MTIEEMQKELDEQQSFLGELVAQGALTRDEADNIFLTVTALGMFKLGRVEEDRARRFTWQANDIIWVQHPETAIPGVPHAST